MVVCVHTHTLEQDSVIKKNETMQQLAAAWVEPEMIIHSEGRQTNTI